MHPGHYGVILERQDNTKEGVTAGATDHGTKNLSREGGEKSSVSES